MKSLSCRGIPLSRHTRNSLSACPDTHTLAELQFGQRALPAGATAPYPEPVYVISHIKYLGDEGTSATLLIDMADGAPRLMLLDSTSAVLK